MSTRPTIVPKPEEQEQPWQWSEERWRGIVERVRAGRTLRPDTGRTARAAPWRSRSIRPRDRRAARRRRVDRPPEPGPVRQPRRHPAHPDSAARNTRSRRPSTCRPSRPCSIPTSSAASVAEGHEIGIHGWIHERNSILPEVSERDLQMRSADMLEKVSGQRPVGIRTPSWDFSPHTLAITRDMGLLYDSSLMADDDCYELLLDGQPTGVVELPVEWIRDDAVYFNMNRFAVAAPLHAALGRAGGLPARVRHGLCRGRALPAHHASAHHRPPLAHDDPGGADPAYPRAGRHLVRDARRRRALRQAERAEQTEEAGNETDNSGRVGRDRRGSVVRRGRRGLGAGQVRPRQQQRLRQSRSACRVRRRPRRVAHQLLRRAAALGRQPAEDDPVAGRELHVLARRQDLDLQAEERREVPRRQRVHRRRRALQHRAHAGDEEGRIVAVPAHHRPGQHQGARQVHGRVHARRSRPPSSWPPCRKSWWSIPSW